MASSGNATYRCECKVFYVESKTDFTKKGTPKTMRIEHRKMFVLDPKSFLDSGDYRIVHKKGKYTISVIPRIAQPWYNNPSGKPETWYKLAPDTIMVDEDGNEFVERPYKRTDDKPMDYDGILRWLTCRLGAIKAKIALDEMLTCEPQSQEQERLAA